MSPIVASRGPARKGYPPWASFDTIPTVRGRLFKTRSKAFARPLDNALQRYLDDSAVEWEILDDETHEEAESTWRLVYAAAFSRRSRARTGVKAEYAYSRQQADHYLIVPFLSNVPGLPMGCDGHRVNALECRGPLVSVAEFHCIELFVSPIGFGWTMVYTH